MPFLLSQSGFMVPLPAVRVSVGEDSSCEVPVTAGLGLAPIHFTLEPWESGFFIQDAGSGRKTLVNGEVTNWRPLSHGDLITAGELTLAYGVTEGAPISFDLPARSVTAPVEAVDEPVAVGVEPFPQFTFAGQTVVGPVTFPVPAPEIMPAPVALGREDFAAPTGQFPQQITMAVEAPVWLPAEISTPPPELVVPVTFHTPPMPAAVPPARRLPATSRRRRLALVAGVMALAAGAAAAAAIWKRQHAAEPQPQGPSLPAPPDNAPAAAAPMIPPAPVSKPAEEPPPPIIEIRKAL